MSFPYDTHEFWGAQGDGLEYYGLSDGVDVAFILAVRCRNGYRVQRS